MMEQLPLIYIVYMADLAYILSTLVLKVQFAKERLLRNIVMWIITFLFHLLSQRKLRVLRYLNVTYLLCVGGFNVWLKWNYAEAFATDDVTHILHETVIIEAYICITFFFSYCYMQLLVVITPLFVLISLCFRINEFKQFESFLDPGLLAILYQIFTYVLICVGGKYLVQKH